jgi:hypothetical protein
VRIFENDSLSLLFFSIYAYTLKISSFFLMPSLLVLSYCGSKNNLARFC